MKTTRSFLLCLSMSLLPGFAAFAQNVGISSDVEIDSSSGMVTATCETNLDESAETYYTAKVGCTLTDGSGNNLASGDQVSSQGDAVVVLQIQGVAGTTYVVNGSHSVQMNYKEEAQDKYDQPGPDRNLEFIDEFNYGSLDGGVPHRTNPVTTMKVRGL